MKITIDSEVCEANGMEVSEVLGVLLIRQGINLSAFFTHMLEKEILVPDVVNQDKYLVTQRWNKKVDHILLCKDKEVPDAKFIENLALEMARLYPAGQKPGTNVMWKGNKRDIIGKLEKFFKLYGKYSKEQILEATKRYIDSFNGCYKEMRVLKYFILKENESDLATQLENLEDDAPVYNTDWAQTLR